MGNVQIRVANNPNMFNIFAKSDNPSELQKMEMECIPQDIEQKPADGNTTGFIVN